MIDSLVSDLFHRFQHSFAPSKPYRGKTGTNWLVSGVWSDDMRWFLESQYSVEYEHPLPNRRRLDAAIWSDQHEIVYAIEWEWDHKKVNSQFARGDFTKVLDLQANAGIAIVHTRADGSRGPREADDSVRAIVEVYRTHRHDDRPVGLIEIRRVDHSKHDITFHCKCTNLRSGETLLFDPWTFSS